MAESRSNDATNDAEPKKRTRRALASQTTPNRAEDDDVKSERVKKERVKKAATENAEESARVKVKRARRVSKKASEAEEPVVVSVDDERARLENQTIVAQTIGDATFAEYPASHRPERESDASRFFFSGDYMFDDGLDLDNDDFDDDFDEDFEQLSDDEFDAMFEGVGDDGDDEDVYLEEEDEEAYPPVDDEFDDLNSDENVYDSDD